VLKNVAMDYREFQSNGNLTILEFWGGRGAIRRDGLGVGAVGLGNGHHFKIKEASAVFRLYKISKTYLTKYHVNVMKLPLL
jgi:hypothetical protein